MGHTDPSSSKMALWVFGLVLLAASLEASGDGRWAFNDRRGEGQIKHDRFEEVVALEDADDNGWGSNSLGRRRDDLSFDRHGSAQFRNRLSGHSLSRPVHGWDAARHSGDSFRQDDLDASFRRRHGDLDTSFRRHSGAFLGHSGMDSSTFRHRDFDDMFRRNAGDSFRHGDLDASFRRHSQGSWNDLDTAFGRHSGDFRQGGLHALRRHSEGLRSDLDASFRRQSGEAFRHGDFDASFRSHSNDGLRHRDLDLAFKRRSDMLYRHGGVDASSGNWNGDSFRRLSYDSLYRHGDLDASQRRFADLDASLYMHGDIDASFRRNSDSSLYRLDDFDTSLRNRHGSSLHRLADSFHRRGELDVSFRVAPGHFDTPMSELSEDFLFRHRDLDTSLRRHGDFASAHNLRGGDEFRVSSPIHNVRDGSSSLGLVHGDSSRFNLAHGLSSTQNLAHGVPSTLNLAHGVPSTLNLAQGVPSTLSLAHGVPSTLNVVHEVPLEEAADSTTLEKNGISDVGHFVFVDEADLGRIHADELDEARIAPHMAGNQNFAVFNIERRH